MQHISFEKNNPYSVAVIIPTFDRINTLERSIRSVISQTLKPEQIVIVDNGYNYAEIPYDIKQYVQIIKTEPRIGPGKARNIGAAMVETRYISFLDDDDTWEENYLKFSIETLKKTQADVVVGQLKKADKHGKAQPYKMFPADKWKQRSVYYKSPGFGGQNLVICKKMFAQVGGFDEQMPASVDRDLAAKILEYGGIIVPQPLSIAVLHHHKNERVRDNIALGNKIFIQKHWRYMSAIEILKANKIYLKRLIKFYYNMLALNKIKKTYK